eukprot:CAMPEP_0176420892 /NCGR_PEP_ID=MMETSP0127-20121128/8860_1 /TAXON_ID=938130 /ORGANISM="Platyophrya macrostoma, Strain WH" /LENGTH=511 /DNA_ID=CAMNT_0017801541 /DNA_START=35 /DNA_END=1570 /DNA_ORIENTATION=+
MTFVTSKRIKQSAEDSDAGLKIKLNDTVNHIRERFEQFMDECKYSYALASKARILDNLKVQSYTLYDREQLSEIFSGMLAKTSNGRFYGKANWDVPETNYLISIIVYYCVSNERDVGSLDDSDWEQLEQIFPTKKAYQIRKRWNSLLKVELLQSPWSAEEDELLQKLVSQYGAERQWKKISEKINSTFKNGTFRHSRQCRERWINYVDPSIKRGKWTFEEDLELMKTFIRVGKKWSAIAKQLGDRTENAVKNRWKSLIRKETNHSDQLNENLTQVDESYEIQIAQAFIEKAMADTLEVKRQKGKQENDYGIMNMMPLDSSNTSENLTFSYNNGNGEDTAQKPAVINQMDIRNYCYQPTMPTPQPMPYYHQNQFYPQSQYYPQEQLSYTDYNPYRTRQDGFFKDQGHNFRMSATLTANFNYNQADDQAKNFAYRNQFYQEENPYTNSSSMFSFKLSNGRMASQEFNREAKRPDSQVFYALVDVNHGVIQVLDKVSDENCPTYLGNQCYEQYC